MSDHNKPELIATDIKGLLDRKELSALLDEQELTELIDMFPQCQCYLTNLNITGPFYEFITSKKHRRGEVVFVLRNTKDHILLHTKPANPDGVYRLLTGGIDIGEAVIPALHREVYEETGFKISSFTMNSILAAFLKYEKQILPFVSYIFNINHISGEPVVMDKSENISGFKWVDTKEFRKTGELLQNLTNWQDWGMLRALPHQIVK